MSDFVLLFPAKGGHESICHFLICRGGAAVDIPDSDNRTALWLAAKAGYDRLVEELVKRGADVNVQVIVLMGNDG